MLTGFRCMARPKTKGISRFVSTCEPTGQRGSNQGTPLNGIPVERKGAPLALEPELLQRYSAHSALVEAARPALRQAHLFLAEANSMIILTDPSGLILETAG